MEEIKIGFWSFVLLAQLAVLGTIGSLFLLFRLRMLNRDSKHPVGEDGTDDADQQAAEQPASESERLAQLMQRIDNLDKFRDRYFELKRRYESLQAAQRNLEYEIDNVLSQEDKDKLKDALERLAQEKWQLEHELSGIEQALNSVLMGKDPVPVVSPAAGSRLQESAQRVDASISTIQTVIQDQQATIDNLRTMLDGVSAEVSDKQGLQDAFDEMSRKFQEMVDAIEILQDENEFLQNQVSQLVHDQADVAEPAFEEDQGELILHLRKQVADKQKAYDQLYDKFTQIEAEYLKLEEESSSHRLPH